MSLPESLPDLWAHQVAPPSLPLPVHVIFHVKDKASHEWHYRGLADSLSELRDTFAYQEFVTLIDKVFGHTV